MQLQLLCADCSRELSLVETQIRDELEGRGHLVYISKEASCLRANVLGCVDVLVFYTSGDITRRNGGDGLSAMEVEARGTLLSFVSGGGGCVGCHSTTDLGCVLCAACWWRS